jgi:hypothetical protein
LSNGKLAKRASYGGQANSESRRILSAAEARKKAEANRDYQARETMLKIATMWDAVAVIEDRLLPSN